MLAVLNVFQGRSAAETLWLGEGPSRCNNLCYGLPTLSDLCRACEIGSNVGLPNTFNTCCMVCPGTITSWDPFYCWLQTAAMTAC